MRKRRYFMKSLLLTSLTHPWKFIWRYIVLACIVFPLIFTLSGLISSFDSSLGTVFYVLIIIPTLFWVRSNVRSEEEARIRELNKSPEEKERERQEKKKQAQFWARHFAYRAAQRHYEEQQAEYERQQRARSNVMYYETQARWAEKEGNYSAAEEYRREADLWKYL